MDGGNAPQKQSQKGKQKKMPVADIRREMKATCLTPECKNVFSFKRVWEKHMSEIQKKCASASAKYNLLEPLILEKLTNILDHFYPSLFPTINFYGPQVVGLVPEIDFVYLDLWCSKKPVEFICGIMKILGDYDTFEVRKHNRGHEYLYIKELEVRCVLNSNYSLVTSTELVSNLCQVDTRANWLVMTIREWWRLNDPTGYSIFSSGDLILEWLVLFFLMIPEIKVIPSVSELDEAEMCNTKTEGMKESELFIKFLLFYKNLDISSTALSPYLGEIIPRDKCNRKILRQYFILINPYEQGKNWANQVTRADYLTFINMIEATIHHMITC